MNKKYLIIRILGNDLPNLHGNDQTINNLEFTLKYEFNFLETDKVYILNRIVNISKKNKIIKLLESYNTKYIDIPFELLELKKLNKLKINIDDIKKLELSDDYEFTGSDSQVNYVINEMKDYNLYLINNNNSRNIAINYGKKKGYIWTFVLDSNSFFFKKCFDNVINNLDMKTEYIILNQKRLDTSKYDNSILLKNNFNKIKMIPNKEPQIAFKNTSSVYFNPDIPYGIAPKAELINSFGIKGPWNNWMNFFNLNIKPRKFKNVNYKFLSFIVRLNSFSKNNNVKNNFMNRWLGLFNLIKSLES